MEKSRLLEDELSRLGEEDQDQEQEQEQELKLSLSSLSRENCKTQGFGSGLTVPAQLRWLLVLLLPLLHLLLFHPLVLPASYPPASWPSSTTDPYPLDCASFPSPWTPWDTAPAPCSCLDPVSWPPPRPPASERWGWRSDT